MAAPPVLCSFLFVYISLNLCSRFRFVSHDLCSLSICLRTFAAAFCFHPTTCAVTSSLVSLPTIIRQPMLSER
ncbi:hypothetical protein KY284_028053 [Solanum tuberosum]|nr:hypothetical protein KY284_028053 [Solanum tuberosum]